MLSRAVYVIKKQNFKGVDMYLTDARALTWGDRRNAIEYCCKGDAEDDQSMFTTGGSIVTSPEFQHD